MKYDFIRCNNLQFKAKVQGIEREGYLKVSNEENVYMFYSDGEKAFDTSLQFEYALCNKSFSNIMDFNLWAENHELEIIPRDPETYTDWKVGDVLKDIVNPRDMFIIQATLGDMVLISDITRYYGYTYTSKCITEKMQARSHGLRAGNFESTGREEDGVSIQEGR